MCHDGNLTVGIPRESDRKRMEKIFLFVPMRLDLQHESPNTKHDIIIYICIFIYTSKQKDGKNMDQQHGGTVLYLKCRCAGQCLMTAAFAAAQPTRLPVPTRRDPLGAQFNARHGPVDPT
jgi:hypothetical protein